MTILTMHRIAFCLLVAGDLWAAAACAQSYTFTTLAGEADAYGTNNGPATAARFYIPLGLALDKAGNIYVTEARTHTIRKMTPNGLVSTLAGLADTSGTNDGVGSEARFTTPHGVAVDQAGFVYVADDQNSTIRKITPQGVVSTLAGLAGTSGTNDGFGGDARFAGPTDVAVDQAGVVYVADWYGHTIRKITPQGMVSTLAGLGWTRGSADGIGSNARFENPSGLAVDSATNIYVVDCVNQTIRKITPEGVVSTLAGAQSCGSTDGIGSAARFNYPARIAVDRAGNLYVTDTSNFTIRKITPEGVVSTLAGLAGSLGVADGTGSDARFRSPHGIAVDSAGNLYVADASSHTIRFGILAPVTPPALRIHLRTDRTILSWPLAARNYLLETSSTLAPGAAWIPLPDPAAGILDDRFVLTNSPDSGSRFYRLRKP